MLGLDQPSVDKFGSFFAPPSPLAFHEASGAWSRWLGREIAIKELHPLRPYGGEGTPRRGRNAPDRSSRPVARGVRRRVRASPTAPPGWTGMIALAGDRATRRRASRGPSTDGPSCHVLRLDLSQLTRAR